MNDIEARLDALFSDTEDALHSHIQAAKEALPQETPYPDLIPLDMDKLVPPPVISEAKKTQKTTVSGTTSSTSFNMSKQGTLLNKNITKAPTGTSVGSSTSTREGMMDRGQAPTQAQPTDAGRQPVRPTQPDRSKSSVDPKLRHIDSDVMEARLKQRQERINDTFKDKGTVS